MKISTQSLLRSRWQHPDDPPGPVRYIQEQFGPRRQEARVLGQPARGMGRPRLMAIHGAGGDYTQLNPILYGLQRRGIGSLAMNLCGHSDAGGGTQAGTTLELNVTEALRFAERLQQGILAMLAVDAGAMVALRAAQVHVQSLHKLVLVDPFLFPDPAFHQPLSQVLNSPSLRWQESGLLGFVQGFLGQVLVITGESMPLTLPRSRVERMPALTPADAILRAVAPRRVSRLIVTGCRGQVMPWLHHQPAVAGQLADGIAEFLSPI